MKTANVEKNEFIHLVFFTVCFTAFACAPSALVKKDRFFEPLPHYQGVVLPVNEPVRFSYSPCAGVTSTLVQRLDRKADKDFWRQIKTETKWKSSSIGDLILFDTHTTVVHYKENDRFVSGRRHLGHINFLIRPTGEKKSLDIGKYDYIERLLGEKNYRKLILIICAGFPERAVKSGDLLFEDILPDFRFSLVGETETISGVQVKIKYLFKGISKIDERYVFVVDVKPSVTKESEVHSVKIGGYLLFDAEKLYLLYGETVVCVKKSDTESTCIFGRVSTHTR